MITELILFKMDKCGLKYRIGLPKSLKFISIIHSSIKYIEHMNVCDIDNVDIII